MELIEVVGIRNVDFTDKEGKSVSGTSVYYLIDADGMEGRVSGKLFVNPQRRKNMSFFPHVGDTVFVNYDRYGKPVEFSPVK